MPTEVKAIVFKTPRLKESKHFFEAVLNLPIHEESVRHFVIDAKELRLVFIEAKKAFTLELYVVEQSEAFDPNDPTKFSSGDIQVLSDPNDIRIKLIKNSKGARDDKQSNGEDQ